MPAGAAAGAGQGALCRRAGARTLADWLNGRPDLLQEARDAFNDTPEWFGIDPDSTLVFYRPPADVDAIRNKSGESGGHHPHGLALGGPEGQTLTVTGDRRIPGGTNPLHSRMTGLQNRIKNRILRIMGGDD